MAHTSEATGNNSVLSVASENLTRREISELTSSSKTHVHFSSRRVKPLSNKVVLSED